MCECGLDVYYQCELCGVKFCDDCASVHDCTKIGIAADLHALGVAMDRFLWEFARSIRLDRLMAWMAARLAR